MVFLLFESVLAFRSVYYAVMVVTGYPCGNVGKCSNPLAYHLITLHGEINIFGGETMKKKKRQ